MASNWILEHEAWIRLTFFVGIFASMALWEMVAPYRKLLISKKVRWGNNLALVVFNTILLRILFPTAGVGFALLAQEKGWGIFNSYEFYFPLAVFLSVLALDLIIYLQHIMVHAIPSLWRLHRVHHADLDYDVTTGSRFHPFEIILSMIIKFASIMVIGPPIVAVVIFEVILNGMAMFNHSNIKLPNRVDGILRLFVVTPDMHRVHHSEEENETNSNFGFSFPWWDRIFGTYIAQPKKGHEGMVIGIHHYKDPKQVSWLPGMLSLPFRGSVSGYAINRRSWPKVQNEKINDE